MPLPAQEQHCTKTSYAKQQDLRNRRSVTEEEVQCLQTDVSKGAEGRERQAFATTSSCGSGLGTGDDRGTSRTWQQSIGLHMKQSKHDKCVGSQREWMAREGRKKHTLKYLRSDRLRALLAYRMGGTEFDMHDQCSTARLPRAFRCQQANVSQRYTCLGEYQSSIAGSLRCSRLPFHTQARPSCACTASTAHRGRPERPRLPLSVAGPCVSGRCAWCS
jgi:hypothetical protein